MNDLAALKLYLRVARLGSFSAAAREDGLSQSQVSRTIADLEESLGARLLSRTTRAVVPTDAGNELLARLEPILVALEDATLAVRDDGELRGSIRVAMPATFGIRVVLPRLATFTERHPALRVQLALDDRMQDAVRDGIDVGIRVGPGPTATTNATGAAAATTKLLAKVRRVVVAAPGYLARAGTPKTPADLAGHRIVGGPASATAAAWTFIRDGEATAIEVVPQLVVDDTLGAVTAAANGLGVTSTTLWSCRDELASGALVELLARWQLAELSVHAYFPAARATRRAARAFVDFLAAELAAPAAPKAR